MAKNTIALSPEIEQQLEYWKIEKAAYDAAKTAKTAREDWIISQLGDLPLAGMSRTLHTEPEVDITLKQERVFSQSGLAGLVARRPYLVGALLKVEYKVDNRQLTAIINTGQDEALKNEVLGTFILKPNRAYFQDLNK